MERSNNYARDDVVAERLRGVRRRDVDEKRDSWKSRQTRSLDRIYLTPRNTVAYAGPADFHASVSSVDRFCFFLKRRRVAPIDLTRKQIVFLVLKWLQSVPFVRRGRRTRQTRSGHRPRRFAGADDTRGSRAQTESPRTVQARNRRRCCSAFACARTAVAAPGGPRLGAPSPRPARPPARRPVPWQMRCAIRYELCDDRFGVSESMTTNDIRTNATVVGACD